MPPKKRCCAITPAELRTLADNPWAEYLPDVHLAMHKAADRIDELEAALRWYADEANWDESQWVEIEGVHHQAPSQAWADYGHRARQALSGEKL
jgi:hypothetical protein